MSCIDKFTCHFCGRRYKCYATQKDIEQGINNVLGPCCCGMICVLCEKGREYFNKLRADIDESLKRYRESPAFYLPGSTGIELKVGFLPPKPGGNSVE